MQLVELLNVFNNVKAVKEGTSDKKTITPTIKWGKLGDAWTVRVEYRPDKVFVHSNKNKATLEKIIKDRYGPKKFWD